MKSFNNIFFDTKEKKVALTFDDGPDPIYTREILNILQRYNVKAAFFVIGQHVQTYRDVIGEIASQGHTIGNHTYHHPDLLDLSHEEIVEEIVKTEKEIMQITGQKPHLFRPPYGHFDDSIVEMVRQMGYIFFTWTRKLDSRDWEYASESLIFSHMMTHVESGGIMLFHDSSHDRMAVRSHTVKVINQLIPALLEQNYQFIDLAHLHHDPNIIVYTIDENKYYN
ncbi:polysaccharide deacetylase family protein [Paenibacillus sp. SYP-B3998]|uniref:Polysaccharide deacetylase family protein n=1 Tax=Paenibacillus sp. SYP-B3998 TaxID=2678564 RepID=A0A6G3ZW74_9BACL|nr:polysaccharide deacetylase family protein [Paenibacillus sp. SYP-B3998]